MLKGEFESNSRKPRDLLKKRQSDSLLYSQSQLTLSQGTMKKGDVVIVAHDDDDDEVRTSASQNYVKATLCTEEFFPRTQYI
jgi:hypothetical protein